MNIYPSLEQLRLMAQRDHRLIPFGIEVPADMLTPVSAFLRLRNSGSKQAFLLESADGGESVGRYTYLGIDPFASLRSRSGKLVFSLFEKSRIIENKASFKAVESILDSFKSPAIEGFPPLTGGAVGYVSYDSVRFLEDLEMPEKGIDSDDIHLMLFKNIVAFDRLKHRVYIITHLENSGAFEDRYEEARQELDSIWHRLLDSSQDEKLTISMHSLKDVEPVEAKAEMGREAFCEGVKKVKSHIRAGDIFQCVISDRFSFPYKDDPFLIYRILRMINPSPYLFYLALDDDEYLLGSSPEMLVRSEGKKIETCPIAGTRPRGKDRKEDIKMERDLLASVKEKAEHLMLVDLGRNDIGRVSKAGSVSVTDFMKVERYSHVMHLVSLVEGRLKANTSPWDALGSCFPAGTLSGAPKIRAMEIISEVEGSQRGPYGGAVVAHDFAGDLNTCITIRSLYIKNGKAYIQSGAGVVADSQPNREYDEVLNKAKAIRSAVAMAQKVLEGDL